MTQDLGDYAKERGIKYFLFNFTDLFGTQRAKLVPADLQQAKSDCPALWV